MILFKTIKNYPQYMVSNTGIVVSKRRNKRIAIKVGKDGYCVVNLWKNGSYKTNKVHRLVAIAFLANPESKRTVNHKDGVKSNNCISNLEWATYSENNLHAYRVLGRTNGSEKRKDKLRVRSDDSSKQVS